MAITVGDYWSTSDSFPLGQIHLSTSWPVFAIMASTIGLLASATISNAAIGGYFLSGGSIAGLITAQMDDLTTSQLNSRSWQPIVAGTFVFIFASNWAGALLPIELIRVPNAELHAPTADINVTAGLALATSLGR